MKNIFRQFLSLSLLLTGSATAVSNCCPDGDFYLYGTFLYWHTEMDELDFAMRRLNSVSLTPFTVASDGTMIDLDYTWKPGVKAGVGYESPCSEWYFEVVGTHYTYDVTGLAVAGTTDLSQEQLSPTWFPGLTGFSSERAAAQWKLNYNLIDIDLGKLMLTNGCVSWTPFFGLRYAHIGQRYSVAYTNSIYILNDGVSDVTFIKDNDAYLTSSYNAGGVKAGSILSWNPVHDFELYGIFTASAVYGKDENSLEVHGGFPTTFTGSLFLLPITFLGKDSPNLMTYNLDLELGFAWTAFEWCNKVFTISAGYMFSIWFDMNRFTNHYFGTDPTGLVGAVNASNALVTNKLDGNLQMHGLTVSANLEF